MDYLHILQRKNKENHEPIQAYKHRDSFQEYQYPTTTYKTKIGQ